MNKQLTLNLSLTTILTALLAFVLGLVLGLWSPWASDSTSRTVSLDGTSTIEVEPDEFVFRPSVEVTDASESAAKQNAETEGSELAEVIKELGVSEEQLKSSLNSYQDFRDGDQWRGVYQLVITVNDEDLSQKIYQALVSNNSVGGNIDPTSQLSDEKREEVEQTARTQAIADAREQAENSAQELGKSLGDVVSVEDVSGFDGVIPLMDSTLEARADQPVSQFYSGTSEVTFTVKATFELK